MSAPSLFMMTLWSSISRYVQEAVLTSLLLRASFSASFVTCTFCSMLISDRLLLSLLLLLAAVLKVPVIILDSISPLTLFFLGPASNRAADMAWLRDSFKTSLEMLLVLVKPQQPSTRTLIPQPVFSTTLILSSSPLVKLTSLANLD